METDALNENVLNPQMNGHDTRSDYSSMAVSNNFIDNKPGQETFQDVDEFLYNNNHNDDLPEMTETADASSKSLQVRDEQESGNNTNNMEKVSYMMGDNFPEDSKLLANPKGIIKSYLPIVAASDPDKFDSYRKLCMAHVNEYYKHLKGDTGMLCLVCNIPCQHWNTLQRHLQTHINFRPFTCELCNRTFYSQSKLKRHQVIHNDIKPYKCPFCDRRLGRTEHLKRHLLVHTDSKPFGCSGCSHTTKRLDGIRRHIKRKHGIEGAKIIELELPLDIEMLNKFREAVTSVEEMKALEGKKKSDQNSEPFFTFNNNDEASNFNSPSKHQQSYQEFQNSINFDTKSSTSDFKKIPSTEEFNFENTFKNAELLHCTDLPNKKEDEEFINNINNSINNNINNNIINNNNITNRITNNINNNITSNINNNITSNINNSSSNSNNNLNSSMDSINDNKNSLNGSDHSCKSGGGSKGDMSISSGNDLSSNVTSTPEVSLKSNYSPTTNATINISKSNNHNNITSRNNTNYNKSNLNNSDNYNNNVNKNDLFNFDLTTSISNHENRNSRDVVDKRTMGCKEGGDGVEGLNLASSKRGHHYHGVSKNNNDNNLNTINNNNLNNAINNNSNNINNNSNNTINNSNTNNSNSSNISINTTNHVINGVDNRTTNTTNSSISNHYGHIFDKNQHCKSSSRSYNRVHVSTKKNTKHISNNNNSNNNTNNSNNHNHVNNNTQTSNGISSGNAISNKNPSIPPNSICANLNDNADLNKINNIHNTIYPSNKNTNNTATSDTDNIKNANNFSIIPSQHFQHPTHTRSQEPSINNYHAEMMLTHYFQSHQRFTPPIWGFTNQNYPNY